MRIDVVTLFPEFIRESAALGVVGRAQERGLLSVNGWPGFVWAYLLYTAVNALAAWLIVGRRI